MRQIRKSAEPAELRQWKAENVNSPQNLNYGNLPGAVNKSVREGLLKEQGYLCAYTLRRLSSVEDCHIEHILPQNAAPERDIDYNNMAACFPKDGGDVSAGYGAPVKGGTSVTLNVDFVSPHQTGCTDRFVFTKNGEVQAQPSDSAASHTIKLLKLDDKKLREMRQMAIQTHGLAIQRGTSRQRPRLKSEAEARRFAAEVLKPDISGKLEPFCVVLAQVALKFADAERARAQRMCSQRGVSK